MINKFFKSKIIIALTIFCSACTQEPVASMTAPSSVPSTSVSTIIKPVISPLRADKILFVSERDKDETGAIVPKIYTMNSDGSNQTAVTNEKSRFPKWSPDKEKIVYIKGNNLYVMKHDGTESKKLSDAPVFSEDFNWSPDGTKIIYIPQNLKHKMYTVDVNTLQITLVQSQQGIYTNPQFSPDSKRILYAWSLNNETNIYTINSDGSEQKKLSGTSDNVDQNWSYNGKQIVFSSHRDGNSEIYIMNDDGTNQTRLTKGTIDSIRPLFSPDGKKIAYKTSYVETAFNRYVNDIYIMDADGKNQSKVSDSFLIGGYAWSPDSSKLAFAIAFNDLTRKIYLISADGKEKKVIDENDKVIDSFADNNLSW